MVRLVSFIGANDSDLLPFFLAHYRRLGVSEFHLFLQGSWARDELAQVRGGDVTIAGLVGQPYSESLRSPLVEEYARGFPGEWLIIADADEFLELPYASLKRTMAALCCLGAEELPAALLQRVSADGRLPALSEDVSLDAIFPCFDFRLTERMNVSEPIWKSKYPLVRVGERFRLLRGNHLPHSGRATAHLPIRAVVHHFKWRDRLLRSVHEKRGAGSNQHDADAYRVWLEDNDVRVPVEGLQPYTRARLFDLGYLTKPGRVQLRRLAAARKVAEGRGVEARRSAAASRMLADTPSSVAQPAAAAARLLDRTSLSDRPGRIAIVTAHIFGPTRTSGIGTAMSALAERLAAAGHDVHVIYCPNRGRPKLDDTWIDIWAAKGVTLQYFPRKTTDRWPSQEEFITGIALFLDCEDWDVIHFHEGSGFAAVPLLLRAAGLRFLKSKMVVTVHGSTPWHRGGDMQPWIPDEAFATRCEALGIEMADLVIHPSRYMEEWCRRYFPSSAPRLVLPNAMTGETRRFRAVTRSPRMVRTVVFFGRIEMRKGIDLFLDAIEGVLAAGKSDFEVIFLGRFGESVTRQQLEERIAPWECPAIMISDYSNTDAIDLLRTEACLAVIPSRADNLPFTVYECLENGIPMLTSGVGGIPEMIRAEDREAVIVEGGAAAYTARILDALTNGIAPASLSFDPDLVDIDLLAVHARLIAEARAAPAEAAAPASKATVIVHGSATVPETKSLEKVLRRWIGEGIEVLADRGAFTPTTEEADAAANDDRKHEREGEACNRLAALASEEFILFCRATVAPFAECLSAMLTLLESTGGDAAVCGYRTFNPEGMPIDVPVFGGGPELSTLRNEYGPGLFMVRKQSFLELGGFAADHDVAPILEWEFLNRLRASGRRLLAVPIAMALVPQPVPVPELSDHHMGRLAAPWIDTAPTHLQSFVRMALHPVRARPVQLRPATAASAGAPAIAANGETARSVEPTLWEPESLLNEIFADRAEPGEASEEPVRLGNGPFNEADAYWITSASDAEACDFLVHGDLLAPGQSEDLYRDLSPLWERPRPDPEDLRSGIQAITLVEVLADRPKAGRLLHDTLQRSLQLTREFYRLRRTLQPASARILRRDAGIPSFAENGEDEPLDLSRLSFEGVIYLNNGYRAGARLFPALSIGVKPRAGMLVATTRSPYHRSVVQTVTSGAQLTLEFTMVL